MFEYGKKIILFKRNIKNEVDKIIVVDELKKKSFEPLNYSILEDSNHNKRKTFFRSISISFSY